VLENDVAKKPDSELINDSLCREIQRSLTVLTVRERDVICSYFGLNNTQILTLEEIGARLGLTRERVRQVKEKAIKKLKAEVGSETLKSYLG